MTKLTNLDELQARLEEARTIIQEFHDNAVAHFGFDDWYCPLCHRTSEQGGKHCKTCIHAFAEEWLEAQDV